MPSALRLFPGLFLAVCFALSLHFSRIGWELPLLDYWAFRETQTALTAQSLLENGFSLAYETPVLGAPWSVPFEFPVYQLCVVAVTKLTALPLDQSGRLVSLLFAYAAFALLGIFVARSSGSRAAGFFAAAFALVSPVYLYGSRAFMIESTALCFTICLLLAVREFLARPRFSFAFLIFFAGFLAGLGKSTTYGIGLVGVAILLLADFRPAWSRLRAAPRPRLLASAFVAALALPFAATLAWIAFTDAVKSRNELADFVTSAALRAWNWGTWDQRANLDTWQSLFALTSEMVLGTPLVWLVLLALLASVRVHHRTALLLAALFATGLFAFPNLYAVHHYYHYANGLFLLAIAALALGALWDRATLAPRLLVALLAAPAFAALLLWGYTSHFLPRQSEVSQPILELATWIRENTPPEAAILVYGHDWSSALPYYGQRHAIMEREGHAANHPRLHRALARLDRPLHAVVFCGDIRQNLPFVDLCLQALGEPERAFSGAEGDVYVLASDAAKTAREFRTPGFSEVTATFHSEVHVQAVAFRGHDAMLVHAPGHVLVERPADARTFSFGFGITDDAYTGDVKTDGVTFAVEFVDENQIATRLFERRLDPANTPDNRGVQRRKISLPPDQAGTLRLVCEAGPGQACDWSVWFDLYFEP